MARPRRSLLACGYAASWLLMLLLSAIGYMSAAAAVDGTTVASARPSPPLGATVIETVDWSALLPKARSPGQGLNSLGLNLLSDDDPQARAALERLKQSWSSAPTEPDMNGRRIRIAGYVVPLEAEAEQGLREFLLVPYFGACIHTPPPPANQIIHVTLAFKMHGVRTMDAMWVSGNLRAATTDTSMGPASYSMDAEFAQLQEGAPRPDTHAAARMRQLLIPLLGAVLPMGLLTAWFARRVHLDLRRTPREVKWAAHRRRQQERLRQREAFGVSRLPWPQRWTRALRIALRRGRVR